MANRMLSLLPLILVLAVISIIYGALVAIGQTSMKRLIGYTSISHFGFIVLGIFAWTWLVKPMGRFSALAGGFALAVILVPIVARTTEEMVRLVPNSLREAALALGYPRWRTSLQIVTRTAGTGIVTGCLVAMSRVAGETAPLLFTALGNQFFSLRILEPMAALPLQVYSYAIGPYDEWNRQAWAGALVLILLVLVLGLGARLATRGHQRQA